MLRKPELSSRTPPRREPEVRVASDDQIRQRAYEIYLGRGAQPGHELEDWLQAERELRTRSEPGRARDAQN